MNVLKNFFVFEGCDGAGTTTQLDLLKKRFKSDTSVSFTATCEPTGSEIGKLIRHYLSGKIKAHHDSLAFLFAADRNEHLFGNEGIVNKTQNGSLVVCDRYVLSSLVYQGLVCGEELPAKLNENFPVPQVLIFFDIDSVAAEKRMKDRASKEIFEFLEFQQKARSRYKELLNKFKQAGSAVYIIDASKSIKAIEQEVWDIISKQIPNLTLM
ncbi:MAG: dTMP kinase [Termitinemataceae bacterium]|nr:MAG: dTMP kinase [Termitinemataceae bacterium]